MRKEMDRHRNCVAFVEMIPVTMVSHFPKAWSNHHQIIKSSANVIIICLDTDFLQGLMYNLDEIITIGKVCVMNSQWDVTELWDISF
jgi:hypothetical protein